MRIRLLQRYKRRVMSAAVLGFLFLAGFVLVTEVSLAQQNAAPPQLKAVPEEAPNDPYLKSDSGDKAPSHQPTSPKGESSKDKSPSVEEWRDEAQKLLDSLGKMLKSIPTYETPTVDEKGDIIIRRRPPDTKPEPPKSSPDSKTYGT